MEELRLAPVGDRLAVLLDHPVRSLPQVSGPEVEVAIAGMAAGDVVLLENLRFDAGEEKNSPEFSQALAGLADAFVMDAFAVAHRAHASTVGITEYLPSAMGFLVEKEVNSMGRALESPEKPLAALMGGAKVSDKILVLENLLSKLDHLFIGGGMCVTFLNAMGRNTGGLPYRRGPAGLRPGNPGTCLQGQHYRPPADGLDRRKRFRCVAASDAGGVGRRRT